MQSISNQEKLAFKATVNAEKFWEVKDYLKNSEVPLIEGAISALNTHATVMLPEKDVIELSSVYAGSGRGPNIGLRYQINGEDRASHRVVLEILDGAKNLGSRLIKWAEAAKEEAYTRFRS